MLAQQLVNGVLLGATYALFALGFTLMFGVLRVINLTYGFYFSAGALVALWLAREAGLGIWLALPLAALASGAVAVVLDWLLLSRLRRIQAPELSSLMVTLGAVLALYAGMTALLGPDIRRLPPEVINADAFQFGPVRVTTAQLLILFATGGAALLTSGNLLYGGVGVLSFALGIGVSFLEMLVMFLQCMRFFARSFSLGRDFWRPFRLLLLRRGWIEIVIFSIFIHWIYK